MKKSIVISILTFVGISLMAFGFIHLEENQDKLQVVMVQENDFMYSIDSRFLATISKEDILNATSILEIYPEGKADAHVEYQEVEITILNEEYRPRKSVYGIGASLNEMQLKLLQSVDYSSHIYVKAFYRKLDSLLPANTNDYIIYYMTVIPEQEATYKGGYEKLIDYLKQQSKNEIATVNFNQLQPGRVAFTVNKSGKMDKVSLESTSGFKALDDTMLNLLKLSASDWEPARNGLGETVDQELVFFFGRMGC